MYLKSIRLKNTGAIKELDFSMPFKENLPKPLILVGKNGSGKSTFISFIVNAIVSLKQKVFDEIEVENGKVYRIRSPLSIHGDNIFYFAKLVFDEKITLTEWQLNNYKNKFNENNELSSIDQSWKEIPEFETSYFNLSVGDLNQNHLIENLLNTTSLLFFPADRFEPPDWLNVDNLSSDLKSPEPILIKGKTSRRIFSRNRLKPTLEWLNSVIFDLMVNEHNNVELPTVDGNCIRARIAIPGKSHIVFNSITNILKNVLCEEQNDTMTIGIGDRNSRLISITIFREEQKIREIKNLMSLSAGESALFCLFSSIVRDADLSDMIFQSTADITGITIIDEIDMHLHVSLQYESLPRLLTLFPKVQFIISLHSPIIPLGLDKFLGDDGFELREMPDGNLISSECYSEFLSIFDRFVTTKKFQSDILDKINNSTIPALLVEGKSDEILISIGWQKLYPGKDIPFEIIPCGIEPNSDDRNGGADLLRRCVEFLSIVTDRKILAIFDYDRIGWEQFNGLNKKAFDVVNDNYKKHKNRDIHAILLPIPNTREEFVNLKKPIHSYLSIEHYFSDPILSSNGFDLNPVNTGAKAFEIDANAKTKMNFANNAVNLNTEEFQNFSVIFDELKKFDITI